MEPTWPLHSAPLSGQIVKSLPEHLNRQTDYSRHEGRQSTKTEGWHLTAGRQTTRFGVELPGMLHHTVPTSDHPAQAKRVVEAEPGSPKDKELMACPGAVLQRDDL